MSQGDEYGTPYSLWNPLNEEFQFELDAAASDANHKGNIPYYTKDLKNNGLILPWAKTTWVNPPYSAGLIGRFMQKAAMEACQGKTIVALTRFDPSTQWFQDYVDEIAHEVRMLSRRVVFVGETSAYNFPTCIIVYRGPLKLKTEYKIWWP